MARKNTPGTLFKIDLGDGFNAYARELRQPFIAVYDLRSQVVEDPSEITKRPVLFVVAVYDRAFRRWKKVGSIPLPAADIPIPDQFIQDPLDRSDCRIIDAGGQERPATIAECHGLEAASVWDGEHVEDRIRDHYNGKENVWLKSLRLKH